jgi:hypothetical protein
LRSGQDVSARSADVETFATFQVAAVARQREPHERELKLGLARRQPSSVRSAVPAAPTA